MKKVLLLTLFLAFTSLSYCQPILHPAGSKLHIYSESNYNIVNKEIVFAGTFARDIKTDLQSILDNYYWKYIKTIESDGVYFKDAYHILIYERYNRGYKEEIRVLQSKKYFVIGYIVINPLLEYVTIYLIDTVIFEF
jgi:hypothetical protein